MSFNLRTLAVPCIALATLVLPGCATIVKGTTQPVTINTEPAGAACNVVRDGGTIGVVDPTPGTVQIGKIHRPLYVNCKKSGYEDISQQVHSRFQTMTLGNILIGGIIGFGVDAMSGAMYEYPTGVMLALVPLAFGTPAERDEFYDKQRDGIVKESVELKDRIRAECKEDCDAKLKVVDEALATRTAEIEARRSSAAVREAGKT